MIIKIIGADCSNGIKLRKMVNKASDKLKEQFIIELVDDNELIKKYNVKNVPALVINDQIISEGKVLSDREITKVLKTLIA